MDGMIGNVDAREVGAGGSKTAESDGDCAVDPGAERSCIVGINVVYTWMRKGGAVAGSWSEPLAGGGKVE
jgi:hypothetical protein